MRVHMAANDGYAFRVSACGVSEEEEPVLDLKGFVDSLDDLPEDVSPCVTCLETARGALLILR